MKLNIPAILAVACLLAAGVAFAQSPKGTCSRGQGNACGGPAMTAEGRAARQAACLEKNGGVCPNGGPQAACPNPGNGQGKGAMKGKGRANGAGQCTGARNGTGPRAQAGTCPNTPPAAAAK